MARQTDSVSILYLKGVKTHLRSGSIFSLQILDIGSEVLSDFNGPFDPVTTQTATLLSFIEYAHKQIKKFTCSNIIVLAGNHDYRIVNKHIL